MNHRHYGLVRHQFVVLVTFHGQLVHLPVDLTHVPRDVVAPALIKIKHCKCQVLFNSSKGLPLVQLCSHQVYHSMKIFPQVIYPKLPMGTEESSRLSVSFLFLSSTYHGLHPVHSAWTDPDQVARFLYEAIHRDVVLVQVIQVRPPRPGQVVDIVPVVSSKRPMKSCSSQ